MVMLKTCFASVFKSLSIYFVLISSFPLFKIHHPWMVPYLIWHMTSVVAVINRGFNAQPIFFVYFFTVKKIFPESLLKIEEIALATSHKINDLTLHNSTDEYTYSFHALSSRKICKISFMWFYQPICWLSWPLQTDWHSFPEEGNAQIRIFQIQLTSFYKVLVRHKTTFMAHLAASFDAKIY